MKLSALLIITLAILFQASCTTKSTHDNNPVSTFPEARKLGQSKEWATGLIAIGNMPIKCSIHYFCDDDGPNEKQVSVAEAVIKYDDDQVKFIESEILNLYKNDIRPSYFATIGDPKYDDRIKSEDLPEITGTVTIWHILDQECFLFIDEDGDHAFAFKVKFDLDRSITVSFRKGSLVETMFEG